MTNLPEWNATRELRIEQGPVVISQTRTDPGEMGEPRVMDSDGVTYVAVPDFDGDWAVGGSALGDALRLEVLAYADEHRECGLVYEGCYSHWPTPHCRADGMAWPCDVDRIRAALTGGDRA